MKCGEGLRFFRVINSVNVECADSSFEIISLKKKNISIGIVNALGNVQSTYFFALPIGTGKM